MHTPSNPPESSAVPRSSDKCRPVSAYAPSPVFILLSALHFCLHITQASVGSHMLMEQPVVELFHMDGCSLSCIASHFCNSDISMRPKRQICQASSLRFIKLTSLRRTGSSDLDTTKHSSIFLIYCSMMHTLSEQQERTSCGGCCAHEHRAESQLQTRCSLAREFLSDDCLEEAFEHDAAEALTFLLNLVDEEIQMFCGKPNQDPRRSLGLASLLTVKKATADVHR